MTCEESNCQITAVYSDLQAIQALVAKEMDYVSDEYQSTDDNTRKKWVLKHRAIRLDEVYDRLSDLLDAVNVPENIPENDLNRDDECDDDDCNCH